MGTRLKFRFLLLVLGLLDSGSWIPSVASQMATLQPQFTECPSDFQTQLLTKMNAIRALHQAPPLVLDPSFSTQAQTWVVDLSGRDAQFEYHQAAEQRRTEWIGIMTLREGGDVKLGCQNGNGMNGIKGSQWQQGFQQGGFQQWGSWGNKWGQQKQWIQCPGCQQQQYPQPPGGQQMQPIFPPGGQVPPTGGQFLFPVPPGGQVPLAGGQGGQVPSAPFPPGSGQGGSPGFPSTNGLAPLPAGQVPPPTPPPPFPPGSGQAGGTGVPNLQGPPPGGQVPQPLPFPPGSGQAGGAPGVPPPGSPPTGPGGQPPGGNPDMIIQHGRFIFDIESLLRYREQLPNYQQSYYCTGPPAALIQTQLTQTTSTQSASGQPGSFVEFAQLVWKGSQKVGLGCAAHFHRDKGYARLYVVAKYDEQPGQGQLLQKQSFVQNVLPVSPVNCQTVPSVEVPSLQGPPQGVPGVPPQGPITPPIGPPLIPPQGPFSPPQGPPQEPAPPNVPQPPSSVQDSISTGDIRRSSKSKE